MSHDHDAVGNVKIAFILNLFFAVFELIGALFTNSLSLLSSGLHDLGDSFSLGISLVLNKAATKEKNVNFTYGYRRLSLVAAFLNSLILVAGAVIVLTEAIPRIIHPEHSNAVGMFIFALIGILVNIVGYVRLNRGKTMSEKVAAFHLLDDVLSLGSVLVISIIIQFYDVHILDPILSIIITIYILWNVIKNFRKTINLFLQATPENINIPELEEQIKTINDVVTIHDTHVWSLDGEHNVLSTHVVVRDETTHEDMVTIKCKCKAMIVKEGIDHATVEIECENERCLIKD